MRAQLSDLVLAYDAGGSGRPLLLVHGYPLNRTTWRPQVDNLTDAARVIAPDLRGHGESNAPDEPYTVDRLADDLVELLDELGLAEPVVVAGLSMGGYVALAFYRRHQERVAGLILAATAPGPIPRPAKPIATRPWPWRAKRAWAPLPTACCLRCSLRKPTSPIPTWFSTCGTSWPQPRSTASSAISPPCATGPIPPSCWAAFSSRCWSSTAKKISLSRPAKPRRPLPACQTPAWRWSRAPATCSTWNSPRRSTRKSARFLKSFLKKTVNGPGTTDQPLPSHLPRIRCGVR